MLKNIRDSLLVALYWIVFATICVTVGLSPVIAQWSLWWLVVTIPLAVATACVLNTLTVLAAYYWSEG